MTSPRQRKKRLALKRMKEKFDQTSAVPQHKLVVAEKQAPIEKSEMEKTVAAATQVVLDSDSAAKQKKTKTGLVEMKPQVQTLEQPKQEVKTETVEVKKETQTKE
jgi:hypothetical protein